MAALIPLARILLAYLFIISGWNKVSDMLWGGRELIKTLADKGLPQPEILAYVAAGVEFLFPILIIVGLATRLAAFGLIVFLVAATVFFHNYWDMTDPQQVMENMIAFNKNLGILGGLILLMVTGAGPASFDAAMRRNQ
jgi:putative oxidoreductase